VYRKRKTEIREGKFFPDTFGKKRVVLFQEIAQDFLAYAQVHKRSAPTDGKRMKRLLEAFGNQPVASITPQQVEGFQRDLLALGLKPSTTNRYLALLKTIFSLALRNGKAATNPVKAVKLLREHNVRIRYLTEEEEARLFAVLPERYRPLVKVALHTGLRQGELLGLTWAQVDFLAGVLTIPRSKHGETRHVPMNAVVREILWECWTARLAQANASPYVFLTAYGEPFHDVRKWFPLALREAGIANFRWHDLRHTFASRLVMAGVDLRTVQELMGHKTIQMTLRYSHLSPSHQRQAVERLVPQNGEQARLIQEGTGTKTDTSVTRGRGGRNHEDV